MRHILFGLLVLLGPFSLRGEARAETCELASPDKTLRLKVDVGNRITYSVFLREKQVLLPSSLSLATRSHRKLGLNPEIKNIERRSVDQVIRPVVPEKNARIPDVFNEITLHFTDRFAEWGVKGIKVDFGFVEDGHYRMEEFRDGINADRYGNDYVKETAPISREEKKSIHMAPGGGWVARISKLENN
ncbi:MAG: glycoside hydrolase family 97 N-terminal domain-containing protein [Candidatus Aminicenantales bacterium]